MTRLDDIFSLRYGHSFELNVLKKVTAPDGVNFVSRAMGNNGVTSRVIVDAIPGDVGEITVALGGNGVLSSFVQPEPFVCGRDVMILSPKDKHMSLVERLWWCRVIWENRSRYSYGRQANRSLGSLLVPDNPPSWAINAKVPTHSGLARSAAAAVPLGATDSWRLFMLEELFEIKKGRRVTKANRGDGLTRFIGASERNNGITDLSDLQPNFKEHCLTVPYNGSVGYAFYQDQPFFASDDVHALIPKEPMSRDVMLFISAVIRYEKERFTYGYKWNLGRMKKTQIRLPVSADGAPDWSHMEAYMQGLPFSAALQQ